MNISPPVKSSIPFIDLGSQRRRIASEVDAAFARVLEHGQFILGPEVKELERALAEFCGAQHVISCANGTDALGLVLLAKEAGPGDAILCPSFTFAATAEVIAWVGATPLFVDVDPVTFNIDPKSVEQGIVTARRLGLNAVGVISVDLFGQPCEYDTIAPICEAHGLWLLDDAAQAFGATYERRKIGTFGTATATSFFPAKPLGCYGDGGAVFTDDPDLAAVLRSLRVHGEGTDKYDNVRIGINGRLDTLQAAVLIEKLKIFPDEIKRRNSIAARYSDALGPLATTPHVRSGLVSTWAQYTIKVPPKQRDGLAASLKADGIPTAVYYPRPVHQQTAYRHFPTAGNGLPVSEGIATQVISLPMHPYLDPEVQDRIIEAVRDALSDPEF